MASPRRELNQSEESTVSVTPSLLEKAAAAAAFVEQFNNLGFTESSKQMLQRMLSTRSTVSTTSTFAEQEEFLASIANKTLHEIGKGTCAEIFYKGGSGLILKRAFPRWETDLLNDYRIHTTLRRSIESAILKHDAMYTKIMVPKCFEHALPNDNFWTTERILPLPKNIRLSLINEFCPAQLQDGACNDIANQDCLARIYMGSRQAPQSSTTFSLRNFPLSLDRIEHLGLEAADFAESIAQGLALLHWSTKCDARDVEFVLGPAPETMPITLEDIDTLGQTMSTRQISNFKKRTVHVWLLDFNQCSRITMDAAGCWKAAQAHWDNDPYFPRPDREQDREIWNTFANSYLEYSAKLDLIDASLPQLYIDAVKAECQRRYPTGPPASAPPAATTRGPGSATSSIPVNQSFVRPRATKKAPRRSPLAVDLDALME